MAALARSRAVRVAMGAATFLLAACASDPLASVLPLAQSEMMEEGLYVQYSVEGARLTDSPDVTYYVVLDGNGNPDDGPLANGPAPISHMPPDPRAYLPFVRSEADVLDREPVSVPDTTWTDYFALSLENGQWTMWQGLRQLDGTVADRARRLTPGAEWSIRDGRTVQLRVPLTALHGASPLPSQLEANLVVARRASGDMRSYVIDVWHPNAQDVPKRADATVFAVSESFIRIPTNGDIVSVADPSAIAWPDNIVGAPAAVNLVTFSARLMGLNTPLSLL